MEVGELPADRTKALHKPRREILRARRDPPIDHFKREKPACFNFMLIPMERTIMDSGKNFDEFVAGSLGRRNSAQFRKSRRHTDFFLQFWRRAVSVRFTGIYVTGSA